MAEKLGDINGKWEVMFKLLLALIPLSFSMLVLTTTTVIHMWTTNQEGHREYDIWIALAESNRFTMADWLREKRMLLDQLPEPEVVQFIESLDKRIARLEAKHRQVQR